MLASVEGEAEVSNGISTVISCCEGGIEVLSRSHKLSRATMRSLNWSISTAIAIPPPTTPPMNRSSADSATILTKYFILPLLLLLREGVFATVGVLLLTIANF